jgi:hypothetical protein
VLAVGALRPGADGVLGLWVPVIALPAWTPAASVVLAGVPASQP